MEFKCRNYLESATRRIKAILPNTTIIVLTIHDSTSTYCVSESSAAYLNKE